MFYFDPMYLVFMLPGLLLMLWAQARVKGTYAKYSRIRNDYGLTGAQAARQVLDGSGLFNVGIEAIPGELTDHYDPRSRVLRLSQAVYAQPSIAAIAVAAHEAGHAIQHAKAYAPLRARTAIVPAVNVGSNLGFFVLIAGLVLNQPGLAWVGVALFGLATVFALITLPVEFDASRRAKAALSRAGLVTVDEARGVDSMLGVAAWTYVAGFATSLLTLLYYVSLVLGMQRRD